MLFLSEKQEFVTLWIHLKLVLMVRWVEKVAKPRAKSPWETGGEPGKVRKMGTLLLLMEKTEQTKPQQGKKEDKTHNGVMEKESAAYFKSFPI